MTVCDARPTFATAKRFPDADEVVVQWPHKFLANTEVDRDTVVCVLTHDPKFDVPLLEAALRTRAAYVGAMGSRRTHHDRIQRLREAGMTAAEINRLRSPIAATRHQLVTAVRQRPHGGVLYQKGRAA